MNELLFGYHAVQSVIRYRPGLVQKLFIQAERRDRRMQILEELALNQGIKIEKASRASLDDMAIGRHQGVVAVVAAVENRDGRCSNEAAFLALVEKTHNPLLLILDGVTDPHNLGACLRSADAAAVTAVVFPKDGNAKVNEVVRKVACGAAETVPWVAVTNLARTIGALKQRGIGIIGTERDAPRSLYQEDLRGSCALVLGCEGTGLRRLTRDLCDFMVSLPMLGKVQSLNVSVAAGICMFEAVRQRSAD